MPYDITKISLCAEYKMRNFEDKGKNRNDKRPI